ncbi:MAG: four helix bundle protein [Pyrinomonadaceae bacterium]
MNNSIVLDKAIKFALRIVGLYKFLTESKKEFVISRQILLSGTQIARHVKRALHSRAKAGFASEMYVGLERALDTELWLLILVKGEFISEGQYNSLNEDCIEMIKLTSSISKTSSEDGQ